MKKLIFFVFILIGCASFPMNLLVAAPTDLREESISMTIHPRTLNQVLKAAAEEWQMSLGATRQAYNSGELTVQELPQINGTTYMVDYDGFCILVVLEDKL